MVDLFCIRGSARVPFLFAIYFHKPKYLHIFTLTKQVGITPSNFNLKINSMSIKIDVTGALARYNKLNKTALSMNGLHKEIGIARQTLGNWDKGERLKTLEDIMKISEYLKCDLNQLIVKTKK